MSPDYRSRRSPHLSLREERFETVLLPKTFCQACLKAQMGCRETQRPGRVTDEPNQVREAEEAWK